MDQTAQAAPASQENANAEDQAGAGNPQESQQLPGTDGAQQLAFADFGRDWINDEDAALCLEGDGKLVQLASLDNDGLTDPFDRAYRGSSAFIDDIARFDLKLAAMELADPWSNEGGQQGILIVEDAEGKRPSGHREPGDKNHVPTDIEPNDAAVDENSPGGTFVAKLHTTDADAGDKHVYEIIGGHPFFEIDGDTIRVKPAANLDFETKDGYDLQIRSTDSHGASITETVHVTIRDVNEAPVATAIADQTAAAGSKFTLPTASHFSDVDRVDHLTYSMTGPDWLTIDPQTGVISGKVPATLGAEEVAIHDGVAAVSGTGLLHLQTNFFDSDAGYENAYGYYVADSNGNPIGGGIIETNAHEIGQHDTFINLAQYPGAASIGFFIVQDGGRSFPSLTDGTAVTFSQEGGAWKVLAGGMMLDYDGKSVLFSDAHLNPGGASYITDNVDAGNQNWEDQPGGDHDFNDVNVTAVLRSIQLDPAASSEHISVTATDKGGLTATTSFDIDLTSGNASFASLQEGNGKANLLVGSFGSDILSGNGGNDLLMGGPGKDYLVGGAGNDIFHGGLGSDVMIGGDGADRFFFTDLDSHDTVFGGKGANWMDVIDLSALKFGPAHDWTLVLDQGSIVSQAAHDIMLSPDSHGYIQLAGDTRITFHEIEAIHS